MKRRALLSVFDKTGIEAFAGRLVEAGWELVSTGGTAGAIRAAGLPVTEVAEVTGHPEMMEGRVKTLHPAIHAGLLARRDRAADMRALAERGYRPIDLVAVNLYPFREAVARGRVPVSEAMEQVDIGGPTMIRAAAKCHTDVLVVVDPSDYGRVIEGLAGGEGVDGGLRRKLAAKVFRHISGYDAAVAAYLEEFETADEGRPVAEIDREGGGAGSVPPGAALPEALSLELERIQTLRYGENPGQQAAFYTWPGGRDGLAGLEQLHGRPLSYNNLLDVDGALLSLAPFAFSPKPAACIVKHTTPCGLAVADSVAEAYGRALRTDPVSAFGSVIAVNRRIDEEAAEAMAKVFVECIVAPAIEPGALGILTKKKNLRLLLLSGGAESAAGEPKEDWWSRAGGEVRRAGRVLAEHGRSPTQLALRTVYGGMLAQSSPLLPFYGEGRRAWNVVTRRAPDETEWRDLGFAWAAVFGVKSNAILFARGGATLGIGAGQMSRIDSSRIAVQKAAGASLGLEGAVMASDAFFPFRDGVDAAAEAGARAIVQPGGSVRDQEVIAAADEHDLAMVFTGQRLFRH